MNIAYKKVTRFLTVVLIISILCLGYAINVSEVFGHEEVNKIDMYIEYLEVNHEFYFEALSFEDYYKINDIDYLVLKIVDNYHVSLRFKFYIEADEIGYYENAQYYYDIHKDILIIVNDDVIIYNDLDL